MLTEEELLKALRELAEKFLGPMSQSFLQAVVDIRNGIDYDALVSALSEQNLELALQAIDVSPAPFNRFRMQMTDAYITAGELTSKNIPKPPGSQVTLHFDMSNPRAEDWLRDNAASRVTSLSDQQREMLRRAITDGFIRGESPSNMAVALAGRLNRQTGQRVGGIIGLSNPQSESVSRMRQRLRSMNREELRKILKVPLRDKRYDRYIIEAIRGKPISESKIMEAVTSYESKLLKNRALTISRTEIGMAVMAARMESWRQNLEKLDYPEEAIIRRWKHGGGGEDPRIQHVYMNNVEVRGLTERFVMPDGTLMLHALDSAGGAKHCANCTCDTLFTVDFTYGVT